MAVTMRGFKRKWINKRYSPNKPSCISQDQYEDFYGFIYNIATCGYIIVSNYGWIGKKINSYVMKFENTTTMEIWLCSLIDGDIMYRRIQ